jgi:hypothetical protein
LEYNNGFPNFPKRQFIATDEFKSELHISFSRNIQSYIVLKNIVSKKCKFIETENKVLVVYPDDENKECEIEFVIKFKKLLNSLKRSSLIQFNVYSRVITEDKKNGFCLMNTGSTYLEFYEVHKQSHSVINDIHNLTLNKKIFERGNEKDEIYNKGSIIIQIEEISTEFLSLKIDEISKEELCDENIKQRQREIKTLIHSINSKRKRLTLKSREFEGYSSVKYSSSNRILIPSSCFSFAFKHEITNNSETEKYFIMLFETTFKLNNIDKSEFVKVANYQLKQFESITRKDSIVYFDDRFNTLVLYAISIMFRLTVTMLYYVDDHVKVWDNEKKKYGDIELDTYISSHIALGGDCEDFEQSINLFIGDLKRIDSNNELIRIAQKVLKYYIPCTTQGIVSVKASNFQDNQITEESDSILHTLKLLLPAFYFNKCIGTFDPSIQKKFVYPGLSRIVLEHPIFAKLKPFVVEPTGRAFPLQTTIPDYYTCKEENFILYQKTLQNTSQTQLDEKNHSLMNRKINIKNIRQHFQKFLEENDVTFDSITFIKESENNVFNGKSKQYSIKERFYNSNIFTKTRYNDNLSPFYKYISSFSTSYFIEQHYPTHSNSTSPMICDFFFSDRIVTGQKKIFSHPIEFEKISYIDESSNNSITEKNQLGSSCICIIPSDEWTPSQFNLVNNILDQEEPIPSFVINPISTNDKLQNKLDYALGLFNRTHPSDFHLQSTKKRHEHFLISDETSIKLKNYIIKYNNGTINNFIDSIVLQIRAEDVHKNTMDWADSLLHIYNDNISTTYHSENNNTRLSLFGINITTDSYGYTINPSDRTLYVLTFEIFYGSTYYIKNDLVK